MFSLAAGILGSTNCGTAKDYYKTACCGGIATDPFTNQLPFTGVNQVIVWSAPPNASVADIEAIPAKLGVLVGSLKGVADSEISGFDFTGTNPTVTTLLQFPDLEMTLAYLNNQKGVDDLRNEYLIDCSKTDDSVGVACEGTNCLTSKCVGTRYMHDTVNMKDITWIASATDLKVIEDVSSKSKTLADYYVLKKYDAWSLSYSTRVDPKSFSTVIAATPAAPAAPAAAAAAAAAAAP